MKKKEFEKLLPEIQEYIKYCVYFGIINSDNKDIILDRLSRTKLSLDVKDKCFGGRTSIKDNIIIVEICKNTLQKEANEMKRNFEIAYDETLFHELAHASSFADTEIEVKTSEIFSEINDGKFPHINYYGYGIISEFVAQSIAQMIIVEKYKGTITYPKKQQTFTFNENGYIPDDLGYSYDYTSDLVFYGEVEEFALKFIRNLYGEQDIQKLYQDHFSGNIFNIISETFNSRKNGIENLYQLFGNMSNIIASDYYQQGNFGPNRYPSLSVDNFKKSINEFNRVANLEVDKRPKL